MNQETAEKIIQMIKNFETLDMVTAIFVGAGIIIGILLVIWELYRLKELKKLHKEYLATLTEEQAKELERNKRYL